MTQNLVALPEELQTALIYMQLPVVGFLAIASFQTKSIVQKAAFALAGCGWILNIGYVALSAGLHLLHSSGSLTDPNSFRLEAAANLVDILTGGCFALTFLAGGGIRLWPPTWLRRDLIVLVLFMVGGWVTSLFGLRYLGFNDAAFVALSIPLVLFNLTARILLGKALFEQTKAEAPVGEAPKYLYAACLFYAFIQPLYLFWQLWPKSQMVGFFLGFVAKAAIALGFVQLFNTLASKFASEQKALDTARRILGRIRHELNTPLGEMKNWVDAAMAEAPSHGKLKQHLYNMESATQRALAITAVRDDVLYQALVRNDPSIEETPTTKEVLNINTILQTATLAVKATRSERVTWQVTFAAGNCIYGSRDQVVQIFVNIFRNAYDAMPESHGRIVMTTAQINKDIQHGFVRVSVTDNGEGFSESLREKAFKDGFTTRDGLDRGHGLSVVRQMLAVNDGEMEIVSPSRPGDKQRPGTEIVISFPRVRCGNGDSSSRNPT